MRVGTVTTGEPGTEAAVVNSGTENDAVLDFTIPSGQAGQPPALELLSAFSNPSQSGTSGTALIFDRNGLVYGTALSHANNSSVVTVSKPGVYSVEFHGSVGPTAGVDFPLNVLAYLTVNGSSVSGAAAQHTFHTSTEMSNVAFSAPIAVTTAPATLSVIGEGGNFLYSSIGITVTRLGDIPS